MQAPSNNKVAIVTGAGSGIGKASALALLRAGYCVVLAGRRLDPLLSVQMAWSGDAGRTLVHPTDVCDESSVKHLFEATVNHFGRVDVLFNNAGVSAFSVPLDELPLAEWKRVVDTNLTGMFLCLQQAFRVMKHQQPQGGRIINNGSISAHAPRPNSVAYTSTKHAVTGLTKSAALDGRAYNIACGQIDIGNAATEMTQRMTTGILQANGQTLVEATMDVQVVADAVVYMAGLPLSANVLFQTVMATQMPFVGRG
jgi:NAD(P)-dependent dehydrogenase (short-subunit alcohol dehydrogenase family)